ncbi:MAG: hypothetical protein BGN82_04645 [Alphaproteobacteria bacterium 65-7]|nr:MAG: hypothetical protein BGN82_04645 [Alphaproteobacteria bacterium 65-7]
MTRPVLIPVLLAGLLVLGACAQLDAGRGPLPPDPKTQMPALEQRIALLVVEQRQKLDPAAKPLALDPELARIARARAADMAKKKYLAHAAPNGETSATLLMKQDARWQGLLGENLAAQHYTREGGVVVDDYAQRFLAEWLKSPPHKENMTFGRYDRAGVGAAVNNDTVYVALLFSTDMGLPRLTNQQLGQQPGVATAYESAAAASSAPVPEPPDPLRLRGAVGAGR